MSDTIVRPRSSVCRMWATTKPAPLGSCSIDTAKDLYQVSGPSVRMRTPVNDWDAHLLAETQDEIKQFNFGHDVMVEAEAARITRDSASITT